MPGSSNTSSGSYVTAHSDLNGSVSSRSDTESLNDVDDHPESLFSTPAGTAEFGTAANVESAIPLFEGGHVEPKKYINANLVPLEDGGQQFLGATVSRLAPAAPQQLMSLFKAAQAAKLDGEGGKSAEIVQFISPLAFYNPERSNDQPMSDLLRSYDKPCIEGVGQLIGCEKLRHEPSAQSPPIRKFTVTYVDVDNNKQTLVLTEIAPDFRESLMTANSIKETAALLDGKSLEGMLSLKGVGRVAIMHVALEVKRAIEKSDDPSSLNKEWVTQRVHEAIEKLERYRPKYLSKNQLQCNNLIEYLCDVANARTPTTPKSDEPIPAKAEVKPKSPLGKEHGQAGTQSVASPREDVKVKSHPQPIFEDAQAIPEPAASPPVDSNVESKPTFIKNAETLGFVNRGNSCYMNSALKFLMLTQGKALIQRIGKAVKPLEKQKELVEKVLSIFKRGSGRLNESEIGQAVGLVSLDKIMIQTKDYKKLEAQKRDAQAEFIAPLREFVERYVQTTPASNRSHESFKWKLGQERLGATLEERKYVLSDRSKEIYESVFPLNKENRASPVNLADKLITHVNDLDCFKNERSVKALDEYKNKFAVVCNVELVSILKGESSVSQHQPELVNEVQEQFKAKAEEIDENVKRLQSLGDFFNLFNKRTIDSTTLKTELSKIHKIFEEVCFPTEQQGSQQDPIELFERCQDVFGAKVFFEHAHCSGDTKRNKNQVQVKFYDLERKPQTLTNFAELLTGFDQTDLFGHNELYVAIRYKGKDQLFNHLDLDHRFKVKISDGEKHFQADSVIFHQGSETIRGHYTMIHRDENNTWTKHDDETVSPKLSTDRLNLESSPNKYRPVMIRLKKI